MNLAQYYISLHNHATKIDGVLDQLQKLLQSQTQSPALSRVLRHAVGNQNRKPADVRKDLKDIIAQKGNWGLYSSQNQSFYQHLLPQQLESALDELPLVIVDAAKLAKRQKDLLQRNGVSSLPSYYLVDQQP
ncbi:hypothetical protein [Hymenobacter volaticus]|uniref:Uncharacterized protein n=1 Tax=Hymenobacter volaticus TaxID=2932254 RepID=A0ABY4G1X4_9BACT|nr:hypothetical protein [Hymenobacter volaticus]UOQ64862.1 hypothetical protein MUN86_14965 [Hymenobacter volaticus]